MAWGRDVGGSRCTHESALDEWRREELGRFLRACRSRLTPGDVGLPSRGLRRVRGLRREEVAELAGVSVGWYTAFELRTAHRVSPRFATAIADVFRLTETERTFLLALLEPPSGHTCAEQREALDALMLGADACALAVLDGGLATLASNETWRRLLGIHSGASASGTSIVDWTFADPSARSRFDDWDELAAFACGALRMQLARGDTGAFSVFGRFVGDERFMFHWNRRTLYDPQDAALHFTLRHPVEGIVPVRLNAVGIARSSAAIVVIAGDGEEARAHMQRLTTFTRTRAELYDLKPVLVAQS